MVVWRVSVATTCNITHISLRACMHCMYGHGILKGTRACRYNYSDDEGDIAPENFGIIPS